MIPTDASLRSIMKIYVVRVILYRNLGELLELRGKEEKRVFANNVKAIEIV